MIVGKPFNRRISSVLILHGVFWRQNTSLPHSQNCHEHRRMLEHLHFGQKRQSGRDKSFLCCHIRAAYLGCSTILELLERRELGTAITRRSIHYQAVFFFFSSLLSSNLFVSVGQLGCVSFSSKVDSRSALFDANNTRHSREFVKQVLLIDVLALSE